MRIISSLYSLQPDVLFHKDVGNLPGLLLGLHYNGYLEIYDSIAVGLGAGFDYISAGEGNTNYNEYGTPNVRRSFSSTLLSFVPSCRFGSHTNYVEACLIMSIPLSSSISKVSKVNKIKLETDPNLRSPSAIQPCTSAV